MRAVLLTGLFVSTVGCDSVGDNDTDLPVISTASGAEFVVEHLTEWIVYDKVVRPLAAGAHQGTVLQGTSGHAMVTGRADYRSGLSCGSDCVRSESDVQLTIVLEGFEETTTDNAEAFASGTITYRDNSWSRQSGLNYSSGGSITVAGTNVRVRIEGQDAAGTWGYEDTITFQASGRSASGNLSGSCQTSNGTTYQF